MHKIKKHYRKWTIKIFSEEVQIQNIVVTSQWIDSLKCLILVGVLVGEWSGGIEIRVLIWFQESRFGFYLAWEGEYWIN